MSLKSVVICVCFLLFYQKLFCQPIKPGTAVDEKLKQTQEFYTTAIGIDSHLFNGREYIEYTKNTQGHPFYHSDEWTDGSLEYGHQVYKHVSLRYDILYDKVIIEHPIFTIGIQLIDENIQSFQLGNKKFIRINDSNALQVEKGFYELLYGGKSQVISKSTKTINEKVVSGEFRITLDEHINYFVLKDGRYFPINSKNSLLDIFADQKNQVKQFIKKNKLKFRSDKALTLIRVSEYYDELKPVR